DVEDLPRRQARDEPLDRRTLRLVERLPRGRLVLGRPPGVIRLHSADRRQVERERRPITGRPGRPSDRSHLWSIFAFLETSSNRTGTAPGVLVAFPPKMRQQQPCNHGELGRPAVPPFGTLARR